MSFASEIWRFFVGVLTGVALTTVLFSRALIWALQHSQSFRDWFRRMLNHYDGWPLVFCRTCARFIPTEPADVDGEHCLAKQPCFVRYMTFLDEPMLLERSGPLCRACDELVATKGSTP